MPNSTPTGSLATALAHARRLLAAKPDMAEAQAREILKVVPASVDAKLLLATALRLQGDARSARALVEPLAAAQARVAETQFELGLTLAELGETKAAIAALRRTVANDPEFANAWLALGDQLTLSGDTTGADAAYARHIQSSTKNPQLVAAAAALYDNKLAIAERLLRDYLKTYPTDVAAIRMLAEAGSPARAATATPRCCSRAASSWRPASPPRGTTMRASSFARTRSDEALVEIDTLLAKRSSQSFLSHLAGRCTRHNPATMRARSLCTKSCSQPIPIIPRPG